MKDILFLNTINYFHMIILSKEDKICITLNK